MATMVGTRTAREYLRVSKGKGRTARSITDQHRENIATEEDHGPWTWGEPYADTGSASKYAIKARDDFDQLTADLVDGEFGEPGTVLVLWEISRLARETGKGVKLIDLCEAGGYLIHITTHERTYNPANYQDRHDLISGINDAEKEARLLSKRTQRGVNSAVADGGVHGKLTFGFAREYAVVDGRSRPVKQYADPAEGPLVIELFERVAGWNGRERESIRAVEQDWLKRGIVSRETGVPFSRQNLGQMLRRKAYVGIRVHKGTERPGNWPALVEPALFDAVQVILADPSRRSTTTSAVKHVLTGVLRCDTCGGKVSLRPGGRSYDGRLVYRCYARDCFTIDKEQTDAYLIGELHPVHSETGEPLPPKLGVILAYLSRDDVAGSLAPDSSDSELSAVRAELSELHAAVREFGEMEPARTPAASRERERSITALETDITALEKREAALTRPDPLARLFQTGPGAAERWEATPVTGQRAIVSVILSETGPIGQCRVRRVSDSPSAAAQDRLVFVRA